MEQLWTGTVDGRLRNGKLPAAPFGTGDKAAGGTADGGTVNGARSRDAEPEPKADKRRRSRLTHSRIGWLVAAVAVAIVLVIMATGPWGDAVAPSGVPSSEQAVPG